jgi:hypothetical protein
MPADPYGFDSPGNEPVMPFDEALLELGELSGSKKGGKLRILDLSGILDYGCLKYTVSDSVLNTLRSQCGVQIELGIQKGW